MCSCYNYGVAVLFDEGNQQDNGRREVIVLNSIPVCSAGHYFDPVGIFIL